MELTDYVRLLRRHWVGAVVILLLGTLAAGLYTLTRSPVWVSTSQLYVSVQTQDGSVNNLLQGSNYTQSQVAAFADLATSPLVLEPVAQELGLQITAAELADSISASAKLNTPLINVTASAASADDAAALSNTVAASMAEVLPELQRPLDATISPVRITVTRAAEPALAPSEPKATLNLALGALVGLALGVGYAVLRGTLDTRVRTSEDVAQVTDKPVLGSIGMDTHTAETPLAVLDAPHSPRAEEIRRLRTNIQFVAATHGARTILFTSSVPAEGKSTTTANLALALADAGLRVMLIDADLRKPRVHKVFGLEGSVGLTTVLVGQTQLAECVQPVARTSLDVLTAGQIPPNPSELLGSAQMVALLDEAARLYDVVLIDCGPVLPVIDAVALAPHVDGVVVVAAADTSTRPTLADTLSALDKVEARVFGIALNRVSSKDQSAYAYSYVYGENAENAEKPSRRGRRGRTKATTRRRPAVAPAATGGDALPVAFQKVNAPSQPTARR